MASRKIRRAIFFSALQIAAGCLGPLPEYTGDSVGDSGTEAAVDAAIIPEPDAGQESDVGDGGVPDVGDGGVPDVGDGGVPSPPDFKLTGPIIWTTKEMLRRAWLGIDRGAYPYAEAWERLHAMAEGALAQTYVPYQGPVYLTYYRTGRGHAQVIRRLAIAYHLSGNTAYRDKAIRILMDWVADGEINTSPASDEPTDAGLVVGRVMSIFADDYALLHHALSSVERARVEAWMRALVPIIRRSRQIWISGTHGNLGPPYLGQQYFNNHLSGHNLGFAAIGYATGDDVLVEETLRGANNPRNLETMIAGAILLPGDPPHRGDPTLTSGAPAAQAGEIYDRYRTVEDHGIAYAQLHLRMITLAALMAYNNDDGNYFEYSAPGGERLLTAFRFYAPFVVSGRSSERTGYYTGDTMEWDWIGLDEIAHMFYPNDVEIREVLEHRTRVRGDVESFGSTAALLFAPGDLDDKRGLWTFDRSGRTEGWTARKSVSLAVRNGSLVASMNGSDPGMLSPEHLELRASGGAVLHLRVRNEASAGKIQVFFVTDAAPDFTGDKQVQVNLPANDGAFHDIDVPMGGNAAWSGVVQQLRIDPSDGATSGVVSFDTIWLE